MSDVHVKVIAKALEPLAAKRQVKCVLSTQDQDRMGDVVVQAGIDTTAFRSLATILWNHDPNSPIARGIQIGIEDGSLRGVAQFPPEGADATADRIFNLVQAGIVNGTSIGFRALDTEPLDRARPMAGLKFLRSELLEWSFVSIPANVGARVIERRLQSQYSDEAAAARVREAEALALSLLP